MNFEAPRYLLRLVERAEPKLREMSDEFTSIPRTPGKWSRKQVLGHLIDSAANNHQRFVRAALADELISPGYEQDRWVALQQYQSAPWQELTTLWSAYNRHLSRVLAAIPAEKLNVVCVVGSDEPITLRALADDYVSHLAHHLRQILD